MVKFSFPEVSNCDLVFVDMPGFDSTLHSSVEDVRKMIQSWLQAA
jgi:GTP-binding protein EngB required for normal cell division